MYFLRHNSQSLYFLSFHRLKCSFGDKSTSIVPISQSNSLPSPISPDPSIVEIRNIVDKYFLELFYSKMFGPSL